MPFGILAFLKLAGSLGLFIYGMKVMSEGLQKMAGTGMRTALNAITRARWKGVLTGLGITAVLQYSSATTVMVVSFVNAGLMNLRQAIPVIMGANIGTTLKALLISVLGFASLPLAELCIPIIGLAFPLMFLRSDRWRRVAQFLIGFALLFLGLMKSAHDLVLPAKTRIQEVPLPDAEQAIRDAQVLIDVRVADEYAAVHIPGAIHISLGVLEFRMSGAPELAARDQAIVLYCQTSGRAALAAAALQEMGYLQVRSITGGFDAWVAAGKPVAKPAMPVFD